MRSVFERVVSAEMDDLYAGAVYLCAGDEPEAERLLLESLRNSGLAFLREAPADPVAWLEFRLVRSFLAGAWGGGVRTGQQSSVGALGAMARMPPVVRSVMWMVVVRRRPYPTVAEALGTDRAEVARCVREGHRQLARLGSALETEDRTVREAVRRTG